MADRPKLITKKLSARQEAMRINGQPWSPPSHQHVKVRCKRCKFLYATRTPLILLCHDCVEREDARNEG